LVGIDAKVCDGLAWLKKHPNTYDAIVSLDFLEHLDKNAVIRFLQLVANSLQEGGYFIARMPCSDGPFSGCAVYNDITHEWAATSGVMRILLKMVGFKEVMVLDDGPVPYKFVNWIRLGGFKFVCSVASVVCRFIGLGSPKIWTPNMWLVGKKEVK
jgi:hypothetical protein